MWSEHWGSFLSRTSSDQILKVVTQDLHLKPKKKKRTKLLYYPQKNETKHHWNSICLKIKWRLERKKEHLESFSPKTDFVSFNVLLACIWTILSYTMVALLLRFWTCTAHFLLWLFHYFLLRNKISGWHGWRENLCWEMNKEPVVKNPGLLGKWLS